MKQRLFMLVLGLILIGSTGWAAHEGSGYYPGGVDDYRFREQMAQQQEQARTQERRLRELERQQQRDRDAQDYRRTDPPRRYRDPVSEADHDIWQRKSR